MKKKITALLAGIFALVITANGQLAPSVTFTATPATVCAGSAVAFSNTATNAPTSWSWYFPGATTTYTTVTAFPGNPGAITYNNAGIYPVTCVVRNGAGKDSVTVTSCVTVIPLPTVTITPAYGGICDTSFGQALDTVYFTTSGSTGNIYNWAPGGSLSCTACPNPHAFPIVTTVYTVTVTSPSGCISTYYDTVTVGSIVAHISGKDSICMGYRDSLVASGGSQNAPGTTYVWFPGLKTTPYLVVSPTVPTTYSCTITSGSGACQSTAVFRVYPFPIPHYTLSSPDSICYPESATIIASPGGNVYQYYWYGPYGVVDSNIFTTSPSTTTTYTLVTKNKGCYFDSLVKIKVNSPPAVYFSGATNLCQGSTTTICATGGSQYHWSTGQTSSCVNVKPPASITYTVQVRKGACFKDTTFTIIVDTMPNVKFKGDTSICTGDSTTIYASGGYTYLWTTGTTADSIHIIGGYPISGLYNYYVTVTKGACSKDSAKITVKVYHHPKPAAYPVDTTVCEYDSVQLTAAGGNYYTWLPKKSGLNHYKAYGDTDLNNAAPFVTTVYTVNVCTWGCCKDTTIKLNIIPGPNGTVCCDTTVGSGTPVQLATTLGAGPYIVQGWSPTYGLSCSSCADPVATVSKTTTYVVTFQDILTLCTVKDSITIDIFNCNVFVPNVFSPNNDGHNDYLYVRSLCLKALDFAVFDRLGNKVFETRDQTTPWDGTYNGKPMDMGTYMWYLNGLENDGTNVTKSGTVTIVR